FRTAPSSPETLWAGCTGLKLEIGLNVWPTTVRKRIFIRTCRRVRRICHALTCRPPFLKTRGPNPYPRRPSRPAHAGRSIRPRPLENRSGGRRRETPVIAAHPSPTDAPLALADLAPRRPLNISGAGLSPRFSTHWHEEVLGRPHTTIACNATTGRQDLGAHRPPICQNQTIRAALIASV